VLAGVAVDTSSATVHHGVDEHVHTIDADGSGVRQITTRELERIEVELDAAPAAGTVFDGYLLVNGEMRALPAGSRLDGAGGRFYWLPGVGFVGSYDLVFVKRTGDERTQIRVRVTIEPRQTKESPRRPSR
jgi:hypothetical protein